MKFVTTYVIAAATFLVLDLLWLGVVAREFYRVQLGPLMADEINWTAALVFYALFILGLVIFVIQPAMAAGSWPQAALYGALFGLICYATYDLTNLATLKGWPVQMALVDMAWGAAVSATVAATTTALAARLTT
jgi:uncharacterized membrane protein